MKHKLYDTALAALMALSLTACNPDFDSFGSPEPKDPEDTQTIDFFMDGAASGWIVGFADYDTAREEEMDLFSEYVDRLPFPLGNEVGLEVSGNNVNSDLFMFIKRRFTGFEPNTRYELEFEITFATNTPLDCPPEGFAPGENVFMKAGATVAEPIANTNRGDGIVEMNIDKGSTSNTGGDAAIVLGDLVNDRSCDDEDAEAYELKTLSSGSKSFTLETDSDGDLWLLFGTDSAANGITTIFYVDGQLVATQATE